MAPTPPKRQATSRPRVWVLNPARAGFLGWLFRYYSYAFLLLTLVVAAAGVRIYRGYVEALPPLGDLERYATTAPGVTRIYANDGALLAELAREYRSYTRFEDIPAPLIQAFLAAEDRRFFTHDGLDYRGLARAVLANLRSGTVVQGGSTITQQVAKKRLTNERTLDRKIREALVSLRLEAALDKPAILEIYLNEIFFGHGAHGVAAAAQRYFEKSLDELTLAECALIAGLARAPSRYNPVRFPERALKRRAVVLQDMVEAGYISPEQRDEAAEEPLSLSTPTDVFRLRDPYYAEHVRRQVSEQLGDEAVLKGGLQIETPADLQTARWAHAAIDKAIRKIDRRQGYRGPETNLADEESRSELIERLRARYGETPLTDEPTRWRLALVSEVAPKHALVELGAHQALLPLQRMEWAAPYNRNTGINDQKITSVDAALVVGDVIWVRGAYSKPKKAKNKKDKDKSAKKASAPDEAPPAPHLLHDQDSGLPKVELGQQTRMEAALYSMDLRSGYVTTMQGGHDYDRSQFNRTTQACRQPGSVFKAVYYALALDTRPWQMDTVLEDRAYEPEPGEEWNPQNIGKTLDGKVLLRTALVRSLNLPSIRLFRKLGADAVVAWSRRLGITSELIADRALSLGASCVHVDELTRAFAIFVRGGTWIDPVYVRRITDKAGRVLVDNRSVDDPVVDVAGRLDRVGSLAKTPPRQIVDRRTAFLITQLMRDVVTSGTATRATMIRAQAGGKSGTSSKGAYTTDTWFMGFTSNEITASWMGDDSYERSMGDEDASYTTVVPMWTNFMKELVKGVPHSGVPGPRPPGLSSRLADARTGGAPVPGMPTAKLYTRQSWR